MRIQILVTTMHAKDFELIHKMNLRNVDVIIANQTDCCQYEEKDFPEYNVHAAMISTNTRGSGLNRNILLAHASAEYIMFADDDMQFVDGFADLVQEALESHPQADAIKFYIESTAKERPVSFGRPACFHRIKLRQIMSAGVPALVVKREKLRKMDLVFPTSIGAGCYYGCGEDSVFYKNLFRAGFSVYASPVFLAYVDQKESTWFSGYDEHFFETTGYVYAILYGRLAPVAAIRRALRMHSMTEIPYSWQQMYRLMKKGIQIYRS